MVKFLKTSGRITTVMLSSAEKVMEIEIWTIDDAVEEVVVATTLKASTVNMVETVDVMV